jgi:hypothetical protein
MADENGKRKSGAYKEIKAPEKSYVLQRCIRRTVTTDTWETVALPVTYSEGMAQLAAVADHPREHRLLSGVPEAMPLGSRLKDGVQQYHKPVKN